MSAIWLATRSSATGIRSPCCSRSSPTTRIRPVDRLAVGDLRAERVLAFLAHLEQGRGCSPRTRNQRLAAIRTFACYVAGRSPEHVEWCGRIRAIPLKKAAPPPVGYLEKHELDALLAAPDISTPQGRRERALLLFLYHTGARASEAAQLTVGRLQLAGKGPGHSLVVLRGKGGKTRLCPLLQGSARALADLAEGRASGEAVFLNRLGHPITRSGHSPGSRALRGPKPLAGRRRWPPRRSARTCFATRRRPTCCARGWTSTRSAPGWDTRVSTRRPSTLKSISRERRKRSRSSTRREPALGKSYRDDKGTHGVPAIAVKATRYAL